MASKIDARLLRTTKFPPEFNKKVDMTKVNLPVMKKWIATKITEIIQNEDDVLVELCYNLIEDSHNPDIKSIQIQLTGFLEKDTPQFCKELWNLLLSGQNSPSGVPKELLEAKKLELIQERKDADRAQARRGGNVPDSKERDRRDLKTQKDSWYGPGRRDDRAFGHRGRRGGYGRTDQRSPSPELRGRGSRDAYGGDSYAPEPRRGREMTRRDRTPSTEESSRSRAHLRSSSHRRGISPGGPNYPRKRSRSPYGDDRSGRRNYDSRNQYHHSRRSVSKSSERLSPVPKRRCRYESRGTSTERRKKYNGPALRSNSRGNYHRRSHGSSRSYSTSTSRSRSRSRSPHRHQNRSRNRSSHRMSVPRDRRHDSTVKKRQYRHYSSSPDLDSAADEYGDIRGRRQRAPRQDRTGSFLLGRENSTSRRRKSSSACSHTSDRVKPADVLKDKRSATLEKPMVSIEQDEEAKQALLQENLLKEKLLREKIIKMRPSSRSGASTGSQG